MWRPGQPHFLWKTYSVVFSLFTCLIYFVSKSSMTCSLSLHVTRTPSFVYSFQYTNTVGWRNSVKGCTSCPSSWVHLGPLELFLYFDFWRPSGTTDLTCPVSWPLFSKQISFQSFLDIHLCNTVFVSVHYLRYTFPYETHKSSPDVSCTSTPLMIQNLYWWVLPITLVMDCECDPVPITDKDGQLTFKVLVVL